ncbi:MAG: metal ABC transporter substrate-binding protein [Ilumatobacteraceae bacterium]
MSAAACGGGEASVSDGDPQEAALAACLAGEAQPAGERLAIATTVAPITSIVANIVGGLADITGIVPEGTNSHTFEPPPSVAATLAGADVVFVNGLVLEEPTKDLAAANMADGSVLCELGTSILPVADYVYDFSFPKDGGKPNPHLWTNPPMAEQYALLVRDVMARLDPANADAYMANAAAYVAKLDALDAAVRTATETVDPSNRKLLTYHDAYAYFARTYGWNVIGAIQPSSFDEPTPKEIADLIAQVRESGVPAIFGSEVFPSPVLEQIGNETGVQYVDVLRDDDLPGEPGDPEHSFLGLMRFDYVTMVEALGGDASALIALDVADVATDTAVYPQ